MIIVSRSRCTILIDVPLPPRKPQLSVSVEAFLAEAMRRIEQFQDQHQILSFVPSSFPHVYEALRQIKELNLSTGLSICEWGSGFGVVSCLASLLGYTAVGIEVQETLVEHSQQLAADFQIHASFHCNSFVPLDSEICFEGEEASSWLTESAGDLEDEGIAPENFDVIFVYPWPGEEARTEKLFDLHASQGALLLSYHGREEVKLQRKVRGAGARKQKRSSR